jgi:hypothetical protein
MFAHEVVDEFEVGTPGRVHHRIETYLFADGSHRFHQRCAPHHQGELFERRRIGASQPVVFHNGCLGGRLINVAWTLVIAIAAEQGSPGASGRRAGERSSIRHLPEPSAQMVIFCQPLFLFPRAAGGQGSGLFEFKAQSRAGKAPQPARPEGTPMGLQGVASQLLRALGFG